MLTAIQMDLSAHIRKHALAIPGKLQLIMTAFAKALEIIPRQICDNAGLDSTDILNKLRMKHAKGEKWFGVDVDGASGVRDNMDAFVWEPALVKLNAISSAAEAASLILSVDETVRNPQSEQVRDRRPLCLNLFLPFYFSQTRGLGLRQELPRERYAEEDVVCLVGNRTLR